MINVFDPLCEVSDAEICCDVNTHLLSQHSKSYVFFFFPSWFACSFFLSLALTVPFQDIVFFFLGGGWEVGLAKCLQVDFPLLFGKGAPMTFKFHLGMTFLLGCPRKLVNG